MSYEGFYFKGRRHQELRPYLRCTYGDGMFPNERLVSFKIIRDGKIIQEPMLGSVDKTLAINVIALENHFWVNREDVILLEGRNGPLELAGIYESDAEKSLVGIRDQAETLISRGCVPTKEIVWR